MNCKICLKSFRQNQQTEYHPACLKKLFGTTTATAILPYEKSQFYTRAREAVSKARMSISGVQPKVQMTLRHKLIEIVDSGGEFILKPAPDEFPCAPENEHVSMLLAKTAGFEVPELGLVKFQGSGELVYIIQRFDRSEGNKIHHEDMMQVFGITANDIENKYRSLSYLDVLLKLSEIGGLGLANDCFKRIMFSYLIGNNDFHLKNISIFHQPHFKLTPFYDVLNTTLYAEYQPTMAMRLIEDDTALPYFGKMGNGFYSKADFILLATQAGIPENAVKKSLTTILKYKDEYLHLIQSSFLPQKQKDAYIKLIKQRIELLSTS
ncbi:MAG TPA: type II toxin-antitoxin system HipA family toxin [Aeromonadales bacterium]|nr:type II toxin-antitoxin system HipA family toxin [Aeromonadales bacterium]